MIDRVSGVDVNGLGGARSAPARTGDKTQETGGFGDSIGAAIDGLGRAEATADAAALDGATGDLASVSDYMIAATEAQVLTEVTAAVRNRAIEAFNDIMRMQV